MQKSIILIIFLMGSLLMSALTFNVNLLSNTAMAQEYDNKNNYDNYNDNNSKYSKYPTEINKYECQTGPFEGFFVSQVEFCKIDFSSNNGDGTSGDKGPTGDKGQPGNITDICPSNATLQLQVDPDVTGLVVTCVGDVGDNRFVYVVWLDNTPGVSDVFFSRSTDGGETFSTPLNISQNSRSFGAGEPQIVVSGNNVYIIWQNETRDDGIHIFFARSTDNGQTFSTPIDISQNPGSDPRIAAEGNNVYAVWQGSTSDIFFAVSSNGGQIFDTPKNLSNNTGGSFNPEIAISGTNVYVIWEDDTPGNQDILFARSTNNGQTFSTPLINISQNTGRSFSSEILAQGNSVYVVWEDDTPGNSDIFFAVSNNNGVSFGTPINISNNSGDSIFPDIGVSGNNVYVVWNDFTPGNEDILFARSINNGQTFSTPPINISQNSGDSFGPLIAVEGNNVYVAWDDETPGNSDIFFARSTDNGQTFSTPPLNISKNSGSAFELQIATQ